MSSGAVSRSSKKQPIVNLSTTEAEFVATASCACQAVWVRRILKGFNHVQSVRTMVFCDNRSSIELLKNPVPHGRSKHIDVTFHFLRELTKDGVVKLIHCHTQEKVANIMTKSLKFDMFMKLRGMLEVRIDPSIN